MSVSANAYAPTTKYSTPWALNSANKSLKSRLTGFVSLPGKAQKG